jgi:stress responsive alpha/beta barrel protein
MVHHIVLLTFKPGHDRQWQPLLRALDALRPLIPGMMSLVGGPYDSPEGFNQGYTHGLLITFKDAAARNHYLDHPEHEKVKADFLPLVEKVVAFDFVA